MEQLNSIKICCYKSNGQILQPQFYAQEENRAVYMLVDVSGFISIRCNILLRLASVSSAGK